jgi:hypothetical protein
MSFSSNGASFVARWRVRSWVQVPLGACNLAIKKNIRLRILIKLAKEEHK